MKKYLIPALVLLVIISGLYYTRNPLKPKMVISGETFYVDIALTPQQIERGLSYRKSVGKNQGMLFVFRNRDIRPFWMFEMQFPLDFIWLDGTKIVGLSRNVPVLTRGAWTVINNQVPFDRVLEISSGTIDRLNIATGDAVIYDN